MNFEHSKKGRLKKLKFSFSFKLILSGFKEDCLKSDLGLRWALFYYIILYKDWRKAKNKGFK